MAKKQIKVGDMFEGAKKLAVNDVEAAESVAVSKQYERIVPVPQIDTYSELPFALVEKAGQRVLYGDQTGPTQPKQRTTAGPKKTKTTKRATRKKTPLKKTSKKSK